MPSATVADCIAADTVGCALLYPRLCHTGGRAAWCVRARGYIYIYVHMYTKYMDSFRRQPKGEQVICIDTCFPRVCVLGCFSAYIVECRAQ